MAKNKAMEMMDNSGSILNIPALSGVKNKVEKEEKADAKKETKEAPKKTAAKTDKPAVKKDTKKETSKKPAAKPSNKTEKKEEVKKTAPVKDTSAPAGKESVIPAAKEEPKAAEIKAETAEIKESKGENRTFGVSTYYTQAQMRLMKAAAKKAKLPLAKYIAYVVVKDLEENAEVYEESAKKLDAIAAIEEDI